MRKYINTNLTNSQREFLLLLDNNEIEIFSENNIIEQIGKEFKNLSHIVSNLNDKNFLTRIEKGKYIRSNFNNNFVIANYLSIGSTIAYWSALNHYGLIEQIPNTVFSQTTKLKRSKKILNVDYKFIKVHQRKFVGITTNGWGNNKFRITNIEKTIIDCFDLPQYSGGYAELIRAFYFAKLNKKKLLEYAIAVNNFSIMKKISYLSELFNMSGFNNFQKETKKRLKNKYTYLSPIDGKKGKYLSRWKLCLNINEGTLFSIINKEY